MSAGKSKETETGGQAAFFRFPKLRDGLWRARNARATGRTRNGCARMGALPAAIWLGMALVATGFAVSLAAQRPLGSAGAAPASAQRGLTTQDYNRKIQEMLPPSGASGPGAGPGDYRIGAEDLLQISVLEAPDLDRAVRVSEEGEISLPLVGTLRAAGLTSRQLEMDVETGLERRYMNDPHVSVLVKEVRSHAVSVFGAVEKPGVFEIRRGKTLIEVLSMAQGLASDAGDTVIVMRHAGDPGTASSFVPAISAHSRAAGSPPGHPVPATDSAGSPGASVKISLKELLESGDPGYNVLVYPGDVVKVTRAGIVYVVGQVRRPGGFLLQTNENISVLQALALAEGLSPTAAAKNARIIESGATPESRRQVAVNLEKILKGKAPDLVLQSQDILFVPNSGRKSVLHGFVNSMGGIATAVSGAAVYRY